MSEESESDAVSSIVDKVKSEGFFDEFRKSCLEGVEDKVQYINLKTKVENTVSKYLSNVVWNPGTKTKKILREELRRELDRQSFLDREINFVVDGLICQNRIRNQFYPAVERVGLRHLGLKCPSGSSSFHSDLGDGRTDTPVQDEQAQAEEIDVDEGAELSISCHVTQLSPQFGGGVENMDIDSDVEEQVVLEYPDALEETGDDIVAIMTLEGQHETPHPLDEAGRQEDSDQKIAQVASLTEDDVKIETVEAAFLDEQDASGFLDGAEISASLRTETESRTPSQIENATPIDPLLLENPDAAECFVDPKNDDKGDSEEKKSLIEQTVDVKEESEGTEVNELEAVVVLEAVDVSRIADAVKAFQSDTVDLEADFAAASREKECTEITERQQTPGTGYEILDEKPRKRGRPKKVQEGLNVTRELETEKPVSERSTDVSKRKPRGRPKKLEENKEKTTEIRVIPEQESGTLKDSLVRNEGREEKKMPEEERVKEEDRSSSDRGSETSGDSRRETDSPSAPRKSSRLKRRSVRVVNDF